MVILWLWSLVAWAGVPQGPQWEDLTPWRTWVLLEHVDAERHWFVVERTEMSGQRCEIGLPRREGAASVWCGPATLSASPNASLPRGMGGARRQARAALAERLGVKPGKIPLGDVSFVDTLRRVTFRQVVPVEKGAPDQVAARTWMSSWDVSASGKVHPSAVEPQVRVTALCAPGLHVGCDTSPRIIDVALPQSVQGHLITEGAPAEARAALEQGLARAAAPGFAPLQALPEPGEVLPESFREVLVFQVQVQASGGGEGGGDGRFFVDVPLRAAHMGPSRLVLPITNLRVGVELETDLTRNRVSVRVRPQSGRYVEMSHPIQCDLVVDEGRVALPRPCEIATDGEWLRWEGGGQWVSVQLAPRAEARLTGWSGPGVRRQDERGKGSL